MSEADNTPSVPKPEPVATQAPSIAPNGRAEALETVTAQPVTDAELRARLQDLLDYVNKRDEHLAKGIKQLFAAFEELVKDVNDTRTYAYNNDMRQFQLSADLRDATKERFEEIEAKMDAIGKLEELAERVARIEEQLKAAPAEEPEPEPEWVPRSPWQQIGDSLGFALYGTWAAFRHPMTASTTTLYVRKLEDSKGRRRQKRRYEINYHTPSSEG